MIGSRRGITSWAATVTVILALGSRVAMASPQPAAGDENSNRQTAALTLFREARRLLQAGRYDEACPKFADSLKLDPGVGTMLNLAYCYERLGRTASAWSAYLNAAAAARDKGEGERERAARARAAAIEANLATVAITVMDPTSPEPPNVRLDGTPVPTTLWGVPIPVDPGVHQVTASRPGMRPWSGEVRVGAGESASKAIVVPALALEESRRLLPPPTHVPEPLPRRKVASLVLGSAGAAGLVAAGALAVTAKIRYAATGARCNADHCTVSARDDRNAAIGEMNAASVSLAIGVTAVVSGIVLWSSAPRPAPLVGVLWAPWFSAEGAGLAVERAW